MSSSERVEGSERAKELPDTCRSRRRFVHGLFGSRARAREIEGVRRTRVRGPAARAPTLRSLCSSAGALEAGFKERFDPARRVA
jgi:hypothetical protein